ncbi:MAG: hypothetical protein WCE21_04045 [Candidatus Babeliales bacterium]
MIKTYRTSYLFLILLGVFHANAFSADITKKIKSYGIDIMQGALIRKKALTSFGGIFIGQALIRMGLTIEDEPIHRKALAIALGSYACAAGMYGMRSVWRNSKAILNHKELRYREITRDLLNQKLCHALSTDDTPGAITYLEQGADINFPCKCEPNHRDHMAIKRKIFDKPEILAIMLKKGLSPNEWFLQAGSAPLHLTRNPEAAQILLDHGADINALDWQNRTPLLRNLEDDDSYDMFIVLYNQPGIKLDKQIPWLHALFYFKNSNDPDTKSINQRLYCTNLLIDKGADISHRLIPYGTPLEECLRHLGSLDKNATVDDIIHKPIDAVMSFEKRESYVRHCDIFLLMHAALKQGNPLPDLLSPTRDESPWSWELIQKRLHDYCSAPSIRNFVYQCMINNAQALELLQQAVAKIHYDTAELGYANLKNSLKNKNQNMATWLLHRQMNGNNRVPTRPFIQQLPQE